MAKTATKPDSPQRRLFKRRTQQIGSFAMINPQKQRNRTAAAEKISDGGGTKDASSGSDLGWQSVSYEMNDVIGEVGFLHNVKANVGAQCLLKPQVFDPEKREWVDDEDPRVLRVLEAFVGPNGGIGELKRRWFLHMSIAGETYLVGTPTVPGADNLGVWWEFLSTEEIVIERGGKIRRKQDGMGGEQLEDDVYVARAWRAHPRFSNLADCAMRRVLPICQEIQRLTQLVDSVIKSKLSADILFVPDEMSLASGNDQVDADADEEADGDEDDGMDPLTRELFVHMSTPISEPRSGAALVPLVMRGPAEHAEALRLVGVNRVVEDWSRELRQEQLDRLNSGLDVPNNFADKTTMNHWGAYEVDSSFLGKHVQPDGDLMADFTTVAYYRPMLEEAEGMTVEDTVLRRLVFDMSPVQARSDEAASARVLYEMDPEALKLDTLRGSNGFGDNDKPEPDEVKARRAWVLLKENPTALGPVLGHLVKGLEDVDWGSLKPPQRSGRAAPRDAVGGDHPHRRAPEHGRRLRTGERTDQGRSSCTHAYAARHVDPGPAEERAEGPGADAAV
jgi:hypothetical protein